MSVQTDDEAMDAMQSAIASCDWLCYLRVRRAYISSGGRQAAINRMIRSLGEEQQMAYGRYFKTYADISPDIRKILVQEDLLKAHERQRAHEERINQGGGWDKPIKRRNEGLG
ncbi:hypothetical protein G7B40_013025 [Aetokthonos hydrillicola Thurmond2011]|jgi:hypothetical protein|uniref:Uncharacterized protein n=1 Tax=Aetokthonos hydrillicola Thurmond2011 TaxID=2712845 RepID=A0AAP5I948_9CYAN|nr:hypothetical protein [Aetokthonos hydrillicola]MBO3459459.1 hypothetical protein [Aetokthonos hydrillicola CCALA 1050]MBW4583822.1 hypothetical protein [Aetokthonos hydrillicola CCALA 1050]MDR9895483.1 hypothetical protein [Aetokthonos hydrillicola Thurmond2011]